MDCIFIAGLLYLVGTDWNGDRYAVNVDMISHVVEDMSISDLDLRSRTMITTNNGTIVEDLTILDVMTGISMCESYFGGE